MKELGHSKKQHTFRSLSNNNDSKTSHMELQNEGKYAVRTDQSEQSDSETYDVLNRKIRNCSARG